MTGFDFAVIAILLVSLLLGVWRGLVYELLSLLGWPVALVLSKLFAGDLAPMLPIEQEVMRVAAAYGVVFVVVLLVFGMLAWLFSRLVKAIGLGWADKALGGLFGVLRGALIVLVLVWLAGLTQIPEQPLWRNAKSSKVAEDVALMAKVWLPDSVARRIHYRNR